MDRKSVTAVLVFVLAYFAYKYHLDSKYPERHKQIAMQKELAAKASRSIAETSGSDAIQAQPTMANNQDVIADVELLEPSELKVENDVVTYQFNQNFGGLDSIVLKEYKDDEGDDQMDIVKAPFFIRGRNGVSKTEQGGVFTAKRDGQTVIFGHQDGAWLITEAYEIPESGYGVKVQVSWQNTGESLLELDSAVVMRDTLAFAQKSGSFLPGMPTGRPSFVTAVSGKSGDWQDIQEFCENSEASITSEGIQELDFIGFDKHYFLKVLVPTSKKSHYQLHKTNVRKDESCELASWVSLTQGQIKPGQTVGMAFQAWFGPKSKDLLTSFEPKLKESIDFGIFGVISGPLFSVMKALEAALGNWGLAIIFLTLLIKIIFYPLTRQAAIAQNKMKKLQPEMNKIKEKHKDDPTRQQQEIMKFMSANKINPAKGCLPVLPQFPVFIAFYRLLSMSIELRQAPFYGWISDLSVADPYYVTPLLLGVTMVVQQKLVPNAGFDKTQERIMMMLPLVFTVMMLTLPAGMVLYMLTNTIVSIAQQQWLNKRLKT